MEAKSKGRAADRLRAAKREFDVRHRRVARGPLRPARDLRSPPAHAHALRRAAASPCQTSPECRLAPPDVSLPPRPRKSHTIVARRPQAHHRSPAKIQDFAPLPKPHKWKKPLASQSRLFIRFSTQPSSRQITPLLE